MIRIYIDYIRNKYESKPEQERPKYVLRDKKCLGKLVREKINNDLDNIAERWYELDDIGLINLDEKFLYLLKEAEELYSFAYYTGTIALVGIASEEYCKYLVKTHKIKDKDRQVDRINCLKNENIITNKIAVNLHKMRKIRNLCIHFDVDFKKMDTVSLKKNALNIVLLYKRCLTPLVGSISADRPNMLEDFMKSKQYSLNDFLYRNRNIREQVDNIDLQINPDIQTMIFTSQYVIDEIDIETEYLKEITLIDIKRENTPVCVDLTLPQVELIKQMKLEVGDIIIAAIISSISMRGQSEEWLLLNIYDVFGMNNI